MKMQSSLFPGRSTDYAFTEIHTFRILQDTGIENPDTNAGNVWSRTIQSYLTQTGTNLVWWGRLLEDSLTVKLAVDWTSSAAYCAFISSHTFKDLAASWEQIVTQPVESAAYDLPHYQPLRETVFSKCRSGDFISALLTFHIPENIDLSAQDPTDRLNRPRKAFFQNCWEILKNKAVHSEGGIVASNAAGGWSLNTELNSNDHVSFFAALRWKSIDSMKKFIEEAFGKHWIETGLPKMVEIAGGRMQMEFTSMYCFKEGWLGSVTKSEEDVPPNPSGLSNFWLDMLTISRTARN
ncbi:hypothetical protein K469DRAFT_679289 [Zopfia rhizophila CBS 207.26]|uniref:ABM domain-containing protein n=1 Tax=Zopfia rhizophila CBS 207.26 TaxID=1314779 RepID=A0A6A6D930_9PEZI|nr:hypothetical protein K469DRAFT_679289 [Zopfia rhizophila CBS 207.26]